MRRWCKITLSVTDGLREQMRQLPDVNWSKVAREAFRKHVEDEAARAAQERVVQEQLS